MTRVPRCRTKRKYLILLVLAILTSCHASQSSQSDISVVIVVDGVTHQVNLPAGSTVQDALEISGITLIQMDRADPPTYSTLSNGATINIKRIREEFETQQIIIPFERQELRNESLPAGEVRMVQAGQNGLKQVTIRHVYEDGIEVSNATISETILQSPIPEIIIVGVQIPFAPLTISGKLVYLMGGNAWIMEDSTANRRLLVATGDLDENIFVLSPDGNWLLYTRKSNQPVGQEINTLWVINTNGNSATPINLHVSNVVHFADFVPGRVSTIAYSTVEPSIAPPGWSANNDLSFLPFNIDGIGQTEKIMDTNFSGIYAWWGINFAWSPNGKHLAYVRPDGIGLVDIEQGELNPLLDITPLDTHRSWAWIPGIAWGKDSSTLFVVTHAPSTGLVTPEESPFFDLNAISVTNNTNVQLVSQAGMFAYPATSAISEIGQEASYRIAFMQAIFPAQSETSHYQLIIMDRDGSNQQRLFPPDGTTGLESNQAPVWAPSPSVTGEDYLATIYQGNFWLIDSISGQAKQITGDGLTKRIDWK